MVGFNPDGSIILPAGMAREKDDQEGRMRHGRCVRVRKEVVNDRPPKKCVLHVKVSEKVPMVDVMMVPYKGFVSATITPTRFNKINDKEAQVEIGSEFRRCSDCEALIKRFGEQLEGNIIVEDGNCASRKREQEFCDEDYFD